MKKFLILFFSLALFLLVVFFCYGLKSPGGEKVTFVVNRGESLISIASRLEKQKIINNKWVFLLFLRLRGEENSIQAGSFSLSGSDSLAMLVEKLKKGKLDTWVTLLEGWRREEIAQELVSKTTIDFQEFLQKTRGKEGYLFPDSYLIPLGASVDQIISILENNFQKKWQEAQDGAAKTGLTQNQIITLASLVEREAKLEEDRPIIAGVLIKRWQSDWPFQVDASIQYTKGTNQCLAKSDCNWWPQVTKADLKIQSPYNGYLNKGLPPTPICNPSLPSILAVVNHQETEYWFYLSDRSGKTYFSRTMEEHQEKINRYLKE